MLRIAILVGLFLTAFSSAPGAAGQDQLPSPQTKEQKEQQSTRETEESSSKDTRIDLSPPADDTKKHPLSGEAVSDAEGTNTVQELQPWDPHKAAKDIEVGDFYYKRKNYRAALDRYKEALFYKPNDAVANFRLGECEEKAGNLEEAASHYQAYLKILPHGPFSSDAEKALERLKVDDTNGAK
jgi:tetratricopeptide (TPR) repeat protein